MPSIFDKISAKLELLRLEKRYTRQRHRRSTFVSNAVYVDGEYIYQTPYSTGSSTGSASTNDSRIDALHGENNKSATVTTNDMDVPMNRDFGSTPPPVQEQVERKRLHRFSSVPKFGSGRGIFGSDEKSLPRIEERRASMIR